MGGSGRCSLCSAGNPASVLMVTFRLVDGIKHSFYNHLKLQNAFYTLFPVHCPLFNLAMAAESSTGHVFTLESFVADCYK